MRSLITIDLGALRRNVRRLAELAEVWAVVKADGYGHGAADCADAALGAGATALCVATVAEALALRAHIPEARIIVLGPAANREVAWAREADLELVVGDSIPEGVRVHVKIDTGMGRWGVSELPSLTREVVGVMTHLATADSDPEFTRVQLERFREATDGLDVTRHAANSAAALRTPEARLDAVRCGVALYGMSPFGADPADDGLLPVLRWESEIAQCTLLHPGDSTGYGRRFIAERDTWIGIVPVGYADGFRRDLTGTEVLVEGARRRVVGTVSMDALAVELDGDSTGAGVTLVGDGLLVEEHARHAGTINYELTCGVNSSPTRARRVVIDS
ncbi:MAG TPA: alanine racemase [Gaiellaceae bacterium]|nr:alanine racemase [Gaiellaceae bacterium]